jgi:hypothetical protein
MGLNRCRVYGARDVVPSDGELPARSARALSNCGALQAGSSVSGTRCRKNRLDLAPVPRAKCCRTDNIQGLGAGEWPLCCTIFVLGTVTLITYIPIISGIAPGPKAAEKLRARIAYAECTSRSGCRPAMLAGAAKEPMSTADLCAIMELRARLRSAGPTRKLYRWLEPLLFWDSRFSARRDSFTSCADRGPSLPRLVCGERRTSPSCCSGHWRCCFSAGPFTFLPSDSFVFPAVAR